VPAAELCRKYGVSDKTCYGWRNRPGGLGASELREVRQLRDENQSLKRLVADLTPDKQVLQDVIGEKL
jgi:putative transposase